MTPTPRTITREATEAAARLAAIREHLTDAVAQLIDAQPGYPTSSGGGAAPQLGDDGKPTGLDRYVIHTDPASSDLRTIARTLTSVNDQLRGLHHLVAKWGTGPQGYDTAAPNKLGDCVCCGRYTTGIASDRLRSGLCMACYQDLRRWREHHTGDRGDWMLERRRTINEQQEDVA